MTGQQEIDLKRGLMAIIVAARDKEYPKWAISGLAKACHAVAFGSMTGEQLNGCIGPDLLKKTIESF